MTRVTRMGVPVIASEHQRSGAHHERHPAPETRASQGERVQRVLGAARPVHRTRVGGRALQAAKTTQISEDEEARERGIGIMGEMMPSS